MFFVAATAAILAARATAAVPDDGIGTVVIIGVTPLPGAEVAADRLPGPVQTANGHDIDRSHALDVTAYMKRMLGSVYVNDLQNNTLQPDVNFRGYTASPLLGTPQGLSLYLDGVRLNQSFGDVVSWDLIPRQAIASLALMPGSNPLFGLNTLGGALALRTKDGFSDPGVSVGLDYGSHERRSIEAQLGGHADNGAYWYATANRLKDAGWRDASPSEAVQAFGKLGLRTTAADLSLSVAYADTDLTGNGLQDRQLLLRDYASVYTKPDNTRNQSYLANLVATRAVNQSVAVAANLFYRHIETRTLNGDINEESLGESLYQPNAAERAALTAAGYSGFPVSGESQDNTPFPSWRCIANVLLDAEPEEKCNGLDNRTATRQYDAGANAQVIISRPVWGRDNRLVLGAGLVHAGSHFMQSSQLGYLTAERGVATLAGAGAVNAFDARVDLEGNTVTRSMLFSDTLQLSARVAGTVSGRYDRTRLASEDALTPAGEAGSLSGTHRFARFNPAAGLSLQASPEVSAYLGYSEGSRAPSVIELGCADPDNPCKLPNSMAGDPPLDQVITRTWEFGVRGQMAAATHWNLGIFRAGNRADILFVADDQSGFGYFKNFGATRRQGIEAGATRRFGPVTLGANYTFLDATYRSAEVVGGAGNSTNDAGPGFEGTIDIAPGDRIALIPRQILKARFDWQIAPSLSVGVDAMNVAGSYARGNENNAHEPDGRFYLGPGRSGGFTVMNIGMELQASRALQLFAQIDNVLDHRYYTGAQLGATGFDGAGNFVARPFNAPIVNGERPLLGSTFLAPGAPRSFWLGVRYSLAGTATSD